MVSLKLKSGETVLIQGGAGGVASFAIQLAKHLGARVITTASAANPVALALRRVRRECLPVPRKAAGT